ncbi:MAG: hypothetical protein HGA85_00520, partial [Nanoarchaeota archaeon]|nr:hypothetical protein [Nanoarchaeota archaeon]
MNRKALEFEIIVKAILALFVLVIMIAILYTFAVVKSGGGMKVIIDDITGQGDGVLSRIGQLFGSGCKDGTTKCGM